MTATHVFLVMLPILMIPIGIKNFKAEWTKRPVFAITMMIAIMAAILFPIATRKNSIFLIIIVAAAVTVNSVTIAIVKNENLARTITMIINIAIAVFAIGHESITTGFNAVLTAIADQIASNPVVNTLSFDQAHVAIVGTVGSYLAAVEINHPIALVLKRTTLMPPSPPNVENANHPEIDEPARGRMIGYLERTIVFLLVLTGNLSAIGFVVVAKGIARFQQLDDRGFAEYFLIGTLMSIVGAAVVGLAFRPYV